MSVPPTKPPRPRTDRRAPQDDEGPIMMPLPRFYGTSTTAKLETRARQLGLRLGVVYGEGDRCDRYFVASMDGKRLERMVPLGWTADEAEEALADMAREKARGPAPRR